MKRNALLAAIFLTMFGAVLALILGGLFGAGIGLVTFGSGLLGSLMALIVVICLLNQDRHMGGIGYTPKFILAMTAFFAPVLGFAAALILGGLFGVRVSLITFGSGLLVAVLAFVVLVALFIRGRKRGQNLVRRTEHDPTLADLINGKPLS